MQRLYKDNHKGYVTVVTVLMLSVMLILIFFVLEWMYIYAGRAKASIAISANSKNMFGNYHQVLFQDYHLLMMDKTLGTDSEATLEGVLQGQLMYSLGGKKQAFVYGIDEVVISDFSEIMESDFRVLKAQIHDYCGYAMIDNWIGMLKQETVKDEKLDNESDKQDVEDSIVLSETIEDPRGFFQAMTQDMLLQLVCPQGELPSKEGFDSSNLPSKMAGIESEKVESGLDFFRGTGISSLLDSAMFDIRTLPSGGSGVELAFYLQACFGNFCISKNSERVLRNEQEYILYGGESDRENLASAVNGIILLRFPFNYACLKNDVVKQGVITSAATLLAVASNTSIPLMATILNGAICYGEGILDVRALLNGQRVPLVKTAKDWRLDIGSFLLRSITEESGKQIERGLRYADYLTILMLLKPNKQVMYYRLLDVITLNIQKKEPKFSFKNMTTKATLQYAVTLYPRFSKWIKKKDSKVYSIYELRTLEY